MQRCIGKHRIEFVFEVQCVSVGNSRIEALGLRRGDEIGGAVDAHNPSTRSGDLLRQRPVPAAQIENSLTRARREPFDDGGSERRHERAILRVRLGLPGLPGHGESESGVGSESGAVCSVSIVGVSFDASADCAARAAKVARSAARVAVSAAALASRTSARSEANS
jgi:hypothetical protein